MINRLVSALPDIWRLPVEITVWRIALCLQKGIPDEEDVGLSPVLSPMIDR